MNSLKPLEELTIFLKVNSLNLLHLCYCVLGVVVVVVVIILTL